MPDLTLSHDGVGLERRAVSTTADDVSVAASAPSQPVDCQLVPTETEHNCDHYPTAAHSGDISSSRTAVSSTLSAAEVEENGVVDVEETADVAGVLCEDEDVIQRASEATGFTDTVFPLNSHVDAVSGPLEAEVVLTADTISAQDSHQTSVVTSDVDAASAPCEAEDIINIETSRQNLGSILAESFDTSTHSAATVVSTQAAVGSLLDTCQPSASSDLTTSAPGTSFIQSSV